MKTLHVLAATLALAGVAWAFQGKPINPGEGRGHQGDYDHLQGKDDRVLLRRLQESV